jgi:hypothetical protein
MNQFIRFSLLDQLDQNIDGRARGKFGRAQRRGVSALPPLSIHFGRNLPLAASRYAGTMGVAGRGGRVMLAVLALSVSACRWTSQSNSGASVTVALPPARPAVPKPAFSFDGDPRTETEDDSSNERG